jgi:sulfatase maturation enzyme AslB (radical SAM superfamily)
MPANLGARLEEVFDPRISAVDLMLTTGCNLRCAYCNQERERVRTMAPGVLDAAIRRLVSSRLDRPRLTLYGGEPLLAAPLVRRALDRTREWAPRQMKPDIRIVTNGTRLDEEIARLLVDRDVFITISHDGVRPAQDDRGPGTFDVLDELLIRLKRDHPEHFRRRLAVRTTVTSRNVSYLAESFRYFLGRGVRQVEVAAVVTHDAGWCLRSCRALGRQLADVVQASVEEYSVSGEIPFRLIRRDGGSHPWPPENGRVCGVARRDVLFVDVDGSLSPCAAMAGSWLPMPPRPLGRVMTALGGLHVGDRELFGELRARERRAVRLPLISGQLARRIRSGQCAGCALCETCFVCPASIAYAAAAGSPGRIPTIQCDFNRLVEKHRAAFHRGIRKPTVGTERRSRPIPRSRR